MDSVCTTKTVYVTVKIKISGHADAFEVIEDCDYDFPHDDILRTEIVEVYDENDIKVF